MSFAIASERAHPVFKNYEVQAELRVDDECKPRGECSSWQSN